MSAFLSALEGREAVLLTDGAGYRADGTIVTLGPKVTIGTVAPIAVTTRGNHVAGRKLQLLLCDAADSIGVDAALKAFADIFGQMPMARPDQSAGQLHVHIAAYSESRGLIRLSGHNISNPFSDGEAGGVLREVTGTYAAGCPADAEMYAACGVRARLQGETLGDYMFRVGPSLMEAWRRTPAALLPGDTASGPQYLIGGQCDFTLVTPDGAATATLRTWPDVVGTKINPLAADAIADAA